jgi:hypothetical protein
VLETELCPEPQADRKSAKRIEAKMNLFIARGVITQRTRRVKFAAKTE